MNKFDFNYSPEEQLPDNFTMTFVESIQDGEPAVTVYYNDSQQIGDTITDNTWEEDGYRYHDLFHYAFATLLGWSPCFRSMLRCKRKSDQRIDAKEDGARATVAEEAISLLIFCSAQNNGLFEGKTEISPILLDTIKNMTRAFEVNVRSKKEWEQAILKAYEMFRLLYQNKGGKIHFDATAGEITYILQAA